ncbi:hypothetical protein KY385_04275 [Candidatus Parcubacteria bacterium]|nr:hypothetical protein [Candidatus Parcubacteria bacterium]
MAYNDEVQNQLRIRHFFFPGLLFFGLESILAVIILVSLNLSSIGNTILDNTADQTNPIDFAKNGLEALWHWLNQLEIFMHSSIFILWATVGVLCYILLFSLFKIIYAFIYSAEEAADLIKKHSGFGVLFWLISLEGIFKSLLVKMAGTVLLLVSTFVFFSYAGNLLKVGVSEEFPALVLPVAFSFVIAILGMRFFVSGIGLLIPAFRRWYYA